MFCGARARPERLTFRSVIAPSIEHFLSLDMPLVRTFIDLCRRPGRVASEYVAGKRKTYINPLKYNLLTAIVLMAVVHLIVSNLQSAATQPGPPGFPARMNKPITRLIGEGVMISQQWHNDYLQFIYVLALPLFALMLRWVLGKRSGRNTCEFYAMSLYGFGQVYLLQAAFLGVGFAVSWPPMVTTTSVLSALSPFVYIPWITIGFAQCRGWRSGFMSVLAFLVFSIFVGMLLAAVGVGYILVTRGMPVVP